MFQILYYVQYALFSVFPLVWLFVAVTILRTQRKSMPASVTTPEADKRPPLFLFIGVASYILLIVTTSSIKHWLTVRHFDHALTPNVAVLNFTGGGKTVAVSNTQEIARFVELVKSAPSVYAHHSHPTERIVFTIVGGAETYSLGADSANADEYWLNIDRSAEIPELGGQIRQLHSPELTAWLRERGLRP